MERHGGGRPAKRPRSDFVIEEAGKVTCELSSVSCGLCMHAYSNISHSSKIVTMHCITNTVFLSLPQCTFGESIIEAHSFMCIQNPIQLL